MQTAAFRDQLLWCRGEVELLLGKYPTDTAVLSAHSQLGYLIDLEDGVETDRSALPNINIGYLAVYQLTDIISHDLSVALCEIASNVRQQIRRNPIL